MESTHDIFISYSRRNLEAVKAVKAELEAAGLSCWTDWDGIRSGVESFISMGVSAIQETKAAFLFILTSDSQASDWAMKELQFAKERARKRVVLVRINDDEMTDEFFFNYQLTDIIDWRVPEQKEKLLRDLRCWAGKKETGQHSKKGGIFISYSHDNLAPVTAIKEELEARGFPCWMDLHGSINGIESGSREIRDNIINAIDSAQAMLFFLSDESQTSEWALKEIDYAWGEKKHVVLVRFNDDKMTKKFRFEFNQADIIDWRQPEQREKLLGDLRRWIGPGNGSVTPVPERASAGVPGTGQCAKCHRWRPLTEMFECEQCGKTYCVAHQDPESYLCPDCAKAGRTDGSPENRARLDRFTFLFSKAEPTQRISPAAGTGASIAPPLRPLPPKGGKKIGPNDPCPCGSGKKYKKCCGAKFL